MANAIVHFEIHASDVTRAKKFYETVFGWEVSQWKDQQYWIIKTGRGTYPSGESVGVDGGLLLRKGAEPFDGAPANAFVCTIAVENIDAAIEAIKQAGGRIVEPKSALDDMGWTAGCKDTEGNQFGLIQTNM